MAPHADIQTLAESDTSTFTVPDRLTIQAIAKRRAASGKLVAGAAAPANVETYKGRTRHINKTPAKRWDHRLSRETQSRAGSSLKNAAKFLGTEGIISLGGGLPSSEYFPFDEVSFTVPPVKATGANGHASGEPTVVRAGKHDQKEGTSHFDISTALQYGQGHGAAQFLRWLVEHTEIVHDPPYKDWSCTMTIGSTSACEMLFRMLTKPGDFLLTEEYTFPAMAETARPMGVQCAAVAMDRDGMLPGSLDDVLSNWDEKTRGGPKPFLVYTVPTGQNPTGCTQPLERRRQIYAVAQKHDLILLEDEPYYFLQMDPYAGPDAPAVPPPASHDAFLKALVPSFLSLDTDGRVIRLDSFSKVVAPGSRVGWITASEQICLRYSLHADLSTQGPSGFSQLALFKLLEEHWGHEGYLDWLLHIREEYTTRRNVILEACEQYLPKQIVSWKAPAAGMFHWLEIDYKQHPAWKDSSKTKLQIEEEIFLKCVEHKVLLMKGSWFCAEQERQPDNMFLRATYAAAAFDQIHEAVKRFGDAVRDSFGVRE